MERHLAEFSNINLVLLGSLVLDLLILCRTFKPVFVGELSLPLHLCYFFLVGCSVFILVLCNFVLRNGK